METFYKISKENAELIGRFMYDQHKMFDPFVNEQKDGTYLVSSDMYELLKQRAEIIKVDFTKLALIDKLAIDSKITLK